MVDRSGKGAAESADAMNQELRSVSEQWIRAEIERLAPFHHDIELPFGLRTYDARLARRSYEESRLPNLLAHAWPTILDAAGGTFDGKRVLDVGCNCGGFSVAAVKSGADHVLGIDSAEKYIEQANFIKRALRLERLEFQHREISQLDPKQDGRFDVSLCFGVLYHLEDPIGVMRKLAAVTRSVLVIDTDLVPRTNLKRPMWEMNFPNPSGDSSVTASTSQWRKGRKVGQFTPNPTAVVELLKFLGFEEVISLNPADDILEQRYKAGRRGTFIGIRPEAKAPGVRVR